MKFEQVVLADDERQLIDSTIRDLAPRRGWELHALNVRTNHVHAVVSSEGPPEAVMQGMKTWATRALVAGSLRERGERIGRGTVRRDICSGSQDSTRQSTTCSNGSRSSK
jgi:REP element-mobilizing transposase RayT